MLNRVERKIMDYLFAKCRGKKTVLMTPKEILQSILPKYEITAKQLEVAMKNIMLDSYIDVYNADHSGSLAYVVTLKQRGEAYQREKDEIRKKALSSLGWKVVLTLVGIGVTILFWAIF